MGVHHGLAQLPGARAGTRKATCERKSHVSGVMMIAIGVPTIIHVAKPTGGASGKSRANEPAKMTFGGVPTNVPTPPIDAA